MSCTNPLKGWKYNNHIVKVTNNRVVGIRYNSIDMCWHSIYYPDDLRGDDVTSYIDIPCRSCLGCYNQSRLEWISRAVAESQLHENMVFLTLTYSDDNIPKVEYISEETGEVLTHNTLYYRDFQLFMKRFRKVLDKPIRYLVCGEYGSSTYRPHYHAIIFGISLSDIPDALPHSKSKTGDFLYSSQWLDGIWSKGFTLSANANTSTIGYVSGYVAKKASTVHEKFFYDYFRIVRPFIKSSLSLGGKWFDDNIDYYNDIYDYKSVSTGDEPVKVFLTQNWKRKKENKLLQNSDLYDILNYIDSKDDRRAELLDDCFLHLDTDMSKEDYNDALNYNFRQSSKRKRGVY